MAATKDALKLATAPQATILFRHRTIATMASALDDLLAINRAAALPALVSEDWPNSTRPLSYNQQQMWILRELGGGTAYNMPLVLSVQGELDVQLLQQALNQVAAHQEVLRTYFKDTANGAVGVVLPADTAVIPLKCLTVCSSADVAASLQREYTTPFDLTAAPAVRALLLSSSPTSHVLCVHMHHIVGDAWSGSVLWHELSAAYNALASGETAALAPLPVQYADYAAWQKKVLTDELAEHMRAYWHDALQGAPALLQLPYDRPRPSQPTYAGAHFSFDLPLDLVSAVCGYAADAGVNKQAVLLGALQVSTKLGVVAAGL